MGVSTLHRYFQVPAAMSPLQYRKQFRLRRVVKTSLPSPSRAGAPALMRRLVALLYSG
jgi:methylphosphotriester-DNA--protein-cysteine methyltransferase